MSLSATQYRAAELTARGLPRSVIANDSKVSVKTISRWRKMPDFEAVVEAATAEADAAAGREVDVDVRDVLKAALTARHKDGRPNHSVQLQAAALLLRYDPAPPPGPPRETIVYRDRLEDGDHGDAG